MPRHEDRSDRREKRHGPGHRGQVADSRRGAKWFQDLAEMVHEEPMALAGQQMESRSRNLAGLISAVREGEVSICVAVPHVDRHVDVGQSEAPWLRLQDKVSRRRTARRRRQGSRQTGTNHSPDLGTIDDRSVTRRKLVQQPVQRLVRVALALSHTNLEHGPGQSRREQPETPPPPDNTRLLIVRHASLGRSDATKDRTADKTITQEPSARSRVRSATRPAQDPEPIEPQMSGQLGDVRREAFVATPRVVRAVPVPRPIDGEQSYLAARGDRCDHIKVVSGTGRAMQCNDWRSRYRTEFEPSQVPAIG